MPGLNCAPRVGGWSVPQSVTAKHRQAIGSDSTPGAFNLSDGRTRWLDVGHDPDRVIAHTDGGGLAARHGRKRLEVSASLPKIPAADRALAAVHDGETPGVLNRVSRRNRAPRGRCPRRVKSCPGGNRTGGASKSYTGSLAEVRAGGARGTIPFNRNLSCECHEGACDVVNIRDVELPKDRDVLAVAGNYARAIGSAKRGTLKLEKTADGLQVELTAEALATPAGQELAAMSRAVPLYARPIFMQAASDVSEAGDVATYRRMAVKAVLIGPTDHATGWPEVVFNDRRREAVPEPTPKRSGRVRRWL